MKSGELTRVFCEVEWRVQQRLFPGARARLNEFRHLLEEHLAVEEREVLPALSEASPDPAQAGDELQNMHCALRRIAEQAGDAIDAHDPQAFSSLASDLVDVLALSEHQVRYRVPAHP